MVDVGYGSPGLGKSLRSLVDIIRGLEREVEILFDRTDKETVGTLDDFLLRWMAGPRLTAVAESMGLGFDATGIVKGLIRLVGLADGASVAALRHDVDELILGARTGRHRDRELAEELSRLQVTTQRFNVVLEGLARVQGRCVARMGAHDEKVDRVERLTVRRDDHITRLIRDTAGQRAELGKLARKVTEGMVERDVAENAGQHLEETRRRLEQVEGRLSDLKRLQTNGAQDVIETLEGIRDRVARLEVRAAEMAREARAKGGRLDALARHVASVDNRLSTALGRHQGSLVKRAGARGESVHATG